MGTSKVWASCLATTCVLTLSAGAFGQGDAADTNTDTNTDKASPTPAIKFGAVYVGEVAANVTGGVRRGADYLDAVGLTMEVNGDAALGWKGVSWFVYGLGSQGGTPGEDAGIMQGVSNIEAYNTWKLYEAHFSFDARDGALSFRAGLYDVNSEFDVIDSADLFLNPSHGIGVDFSQSGRNGPSIFPTTSLGVRLRGLVKDRLYLQGAVLDGVPGKETDPNGTHIELSRDDGLLALVEVGYLHPHLSATGKLAVGAWHYTGTFEAVDSMSGSTTVYRGQQGAYLLADWPLTREAGTKDQGLSAFFRYGFADADTNPVAHYLGVGAVYCGLVPGRPSDKLGIAVATALAGDRYRAMMNGDRAEVIVELSYQYKVKSWMWLQPDLQYIVNPSMDPAVSNAVVLITRLKISFEAATHLRRGK